MSRGEILRRLVHVLIGLGAYLVPLIGVDAALVLAICAIPANAWLLRHLPGLRSVIRADGSTRAIWLYPFSVALLLAIFHHDVRFAQAGWLALGLGDGLAPFLAMVIRGPHWPWNPRKRIAVSATAALVAAVATLPVLPIPAAVAVLAAGIVADSLPLEDNVTWPLLTAGAAWTCGTSF
jgi:dolichol kinase